MTSPVDVLNMALGLAGARSIVSSFSENTPEANQGSIWYNRDRLWILRAHRWNFAREQGQLTLLATAPGIDGEPFTNLPWAFMPWSYSYSYPSDCVQFQYVIPTYNIQPWSQQPWTASQPPVRFIVSSFQDPTNLTTRAIFTNQTLAYGVWTRDVTNPDLFDSQFMEAFAYRLAASLTIPLSGDKSLANALFQKCKEVLLEAQAKDGNEGLTIQNSVPDWLKTRGYLASDEYPDYGGFGWGNWGAI